MINWSVLMLKAACGTGALFILAVILLPPGRLKENVLITLFVVYLTELMTSMLLCM